MNKTEKTEHCQYIQNEKYEDGAAIDAGLYWRRFKKSNQTFPTISALPGPLITDTYFYYLTPLHASFLLLNGVCMRKLVKKDFTVHFICILWRVTMLLLPYISKIRKPNAYSRFTRVQVSDWVKKNQI